MKDALMVAFNKSIATEFEAKLKRGVEQHELIPEQEAFFNAFRAQDRSLFGEAVAGSGKTYLLLRSALSVKANWTTKTLHGLGYSAWVSKIGKRLTVKQNKMFQLAKELNIDREMFGDTLRLAAHAKNYGILAPGIRGKELTPDSPEVWDDLMDMYDLDADPKQVLELLEASVIQAQKGIVDFDDMLYMPVCYSGVFHKHDLVVVDEAQDLSSIQHEMLRKSLRRDGILIGCGDRHQAIYGFRGALAESIPQMISDFSMELFPLPVTFRCPKAVVTEAQADVPHIRAFDSNPEGEVLRPESLRLAEVPRTVLCRNTAPLVQLALRLIGDGRGATIAGREIGKTLAKMVEKVAPKPVNLPTLQAKLNAFIEAEIARKPKREQTMRDRQAALDHIMSRAEALQGGHATSTTIVQIIKELYDKNAPGSVWLSTIHRSKGLEWPDVLMLDPHLLPSSYARQQWQLVQESNLRYVGVTRAQQRLTFGYSDQIF